MQWMLPRLLALDVASDVTYTLAEPLVRVWRAHENQQDARVYPDIAAARDALRAEKASGASRLYLA
jgi:hypothetical protein